MPFADELIDTSTGYALARAVEAAAPGSGRASALREAAATLGRDRSPRLRDRVDLLRDALLADVPGDTARLAALVRTAAGAGLPFHGWLIWPVTEAVAVRAVAEDADRATDLALDLLAELTGRLSSEFALRLLLNHDLDRTLDRAARWTAAPDVDVRRLASEGTRPYLPWAIRVEALRTRAEATVPVLDRLYRDDSEYVRRSVANHLNDIARHAPAVALDTAARWLAAPALTTEHLVRHGLRGLLKHGNPEALRLLGHPSADRVQVDGPVLAATSLPFDGDLTFSARLTNTGPDPIALVVDYRVHHVKADGRRVPKAFRLATRTLAAGGHVDVRRTHSFRPITTRRYHPGLHALDLQINGTRTRPVEFTLLPPAE